MEQAVTWFLTGEADVFREGDGLRSDRVDDCDNEGRWEVRIVAALSVFPC